MVNCFIGAALAAELRCVFILEHPLGRVVMVMVMLSRVYAKK